MAKNLKLNGTDIGTKAEWTQYTDTNNIGATNVQGAIDYLVENGGGSGVSSVSYPLANKKFGIIGDSFTAGGGWISSMGVVLRAGEKKNAAVSGGAWWGNDSLSAYAQAQELRASFTADGIEPDYILCVLGTNDFANTRTLGSIVNSDVISNYDTSTFTGGAQATLTYIKKNFPTAIIKIGWTPAGQIHGDTYSGISDYVERLKELAFVYGCQYIDTLAMGIGTIITEDKETYSGSVTNGVWSGTGHPSSAGQTRIGEYMARLLLSNL